VPPAERDSSCRRPLPLAWLSREELAWEFEHACRVALGEHRAKRGGGTLAWLDHPLIQSVLEEFTRRYLERTEEIDYWDRLWVIS
jgi:hypothetical protein